LETIVPEGNVRLAAVLLVWGTSIIAWPLPAAFADYYTYTDQNGVACMTNSLSAVPAKFRATMKVVRDDKPGKQELSAPRQAVQPTRSPASTPAVEEKEQPLLVADETKAVPQTKPLAARFPWLKPLAVVCGLCGIFVLITKLVTVLPSPLLARAIYMAFFLGIFVCAYKLYADHIVGSYFAVKTKVIRLFAAANARRAPETGEAAPGSPTLDTKPQDQQ
jgi:hypothetical protein